MRILSLLALTLALTSCLPMDNKMTAHGPQKTCTLMGALTHIEVGLGTVPSQQPYLAAAVDGDTVVADECNPGLDTDFQISRSRGDAYLMKLSPYLKVEDDIITDEIDFNRKMKVKLFTRSSCDQPLQPLAENDQVALTWVPLYPNGSHCEAAGHNGYGDF